MWGRLAISVVLAGCTFTPNPSGAPRDGTLGSEPLAIDAPRAGSGSATPDAAIDAPPDAPSITLLPCPVTYILSDAGHPGSKYRQVTSSGNWSNAEATCERDQVATVTGPAHLIVLDDAAEATFAWNLMNSDQWSGHSDLQTEGTWLPVTSQPGVYTGAASGNNGGKNCLMIHNTGGVTNAETCTNSHPFVCECDGRAANPANF